MSKFNDINIGKNKNIVGNNNSNNNNTTIVNNHYHSRSNNNDQDVVGMVIICLIHTHPFNFFNSKSI